MGLLLVKTMIVRATPTAAAVHLSTGYTKSGHEFSLCERGGNKTGYW
jgi:hypothetical protein